MEVLKQFSQQFPTDLNVLDDVLMWFDQLNEPPIPRKIWLKCQLALAEGFTNAVRHAHKGLSTEVPIEIEVTLYQESLEVRIIDQGPPFNLEQRLKTMPETVSEKASGGRGIAILHKIADFLSYTRTSDHRNCLLIVKHFPSSDP